MFKKILFYIVIVLIGSYLTASVIAFNNKSDEIVCQKLDLIIQDSIYAGFITRKEICDILKKKDLDPVGKPMEQVDIQSIEDLLTKHPLIDQVECYKTPKGRFCVEVSQRIPILRIMSQHGENYYIDNKGVIMPPSTKCVAHLAVVTGHVEKSFAMRDLYRFALFLQQNSFWKSQIEQIHVLKNNSIELVPRVGDHTIYLGRMNNFEKKLARVKKFYEEGLNKVGWNKYSRINVEFSNQIICTRR